MGKLEKEIEELKKKNSEFEIKFQTFGKNNEKKIIMNFLKIQK